MAMLNSDPSLPFSNPESFLRIWRQQRAFRVARTICRVGLPLSFMATVVDLFFSTWPVWSGDILLFVSCAYSLYLSRQKNNPEQLHFSWWPAYGSYWISSFGTFWETGGINSPFLSMVLIVLYICGVIVQTQIPQIFIFLFILGNVAFWLGLEFFYPLSHLASAQEPVFTASTLALGFSILAACISEMVRTEKQISQELLGRYLELNDTRQRLEREELANAAKSTFLANVSHELRTPLGAILGFTDLMKEENSTASEKKIYLETIQRNGKALAKLVDDLLDISKVEAGKVEIEKIEFSLQQVLAETFEVFTPLARKKSLSLKLESVTAFPSVVVSDPLRVRQVLMNALGNALKFTERGGVTLKVRFQGFQVPGQGRFEIEISDTGRGMSLEEQEKLFKPFSQADASMARQYGGTGLGLHLSRKLAQLLGGDFQLIASEKNRGSTFVFTFGVRFRVDAKQVPPHSQQAVAPVSVPIPVPDTLKQEANRSTTHQRPQELKGFRILVVDDILDNLNLVRAYLGATGAQIETAQNGLEGVSKAISAPYDVILMDVQMPVLDGLEATRRIRAHQFQGSILALTAHAMKEDRESCLKAGCDDYLTKPISRSALIEKIKCNYQNRLQSRAAASGTLVPEELASEKQNQSL